MKIYENHWMLLALNHNGYLFRGFSVNNNNNHDDHDNQIFHIPKEIKSNQPFELCMQSIIIIKTTNVSAFIHFRFFLFFFLVVMDENLTFFA